jgi:hypothetical protein
VDIPPKVTTNQIINLALEFKVVKNGEKNPDPGYP